MTTPSYLSRSEVRAIEAKQRQRKQYIRTNEALENALEHRALSEEENMERYFTALASRLLRAKFHAMPHYTNEELAYLVGCPTGTYLGQIMLRKRSCSEMLAKLISGELRKLEIKEGMTPMYQPEWPGDMI